MYVWITKRHGTFLAPSLRRIFQKISRYLCQFLKKLPAAVLYSPFQCKNSNINIFKTICSHINFNTLCDNAMVCLNTFNNYLLIIFTYIWVLTLRPAITPRGSCGLRCTEVGQPWSNLSQIVDQNVVSEASGSRADRVRLVWIKLVSGQDQHFAIYDGHWAELLTQGLLVSTTHTTVYIIYCLWYDYE